MLATCFYQMKYLTPTEYLFPGNQAVKRHLQSTTRCFKKPAVHRLSTEFMFTLSAVVYNK